VVVDVDVDVVVNGDVAGDETSRNGDEILETAKRNA
jgi:hypothetical protein